MGFDPMASSITTDILTTAPPIFSYRIYDRNCISLLKRFFWHKIVAGLPHLADHTITATATTILIYHYHI